MPEEKALIPFKGVNLYSIQKRIDKVVQGMRHHYDTEPTGQDFETFVQDMYKCFPPNLRYDIFFASVMDMVGRRMTRDLIRDTAWRLAGNIVKLRNGTPVPAWTRQSELEWCPVTIIRANPGRDRNGKLGFFYDYRVMAGQPASLKFTTWWSLKYLRFIARSMGFKRTRKMYYKLTDGSELVRMRMYMLFDPALSKEDRPVAYHFHVPDSCKKYNQTILAQRFRITPCPLGYLLSEMACHHCPIGYDECASACHPKTFITKVCPRCAQEAWFDPLGRGVLCLDCEEMERRGHGKQ